jgi:glycosyltransferase involved in cell wall biosynthesis
MAHPPERPGSPPLVSVVVPTRERPELALRAVRSALGQTIRDLEVVVAVDGEDAHGDGGTAIADLDARVRVLVLPQRLGSAEARNVAVRASNGRWIAFLDDDDEWMEEKLERQLETAHAVKASIAHPIVSCRAIARRDGGDVVWPRRLPGAGETIGDYLFARRGFFAGDGFLQTSTLLTTRELLLRQPLRAELTRHEEVDWLLRAVRCDDVALLFVSRSEPLAIWNDQRARGRISTASDWRASLRWIDESRDLVTPRAYASFLLTWVAANAAQEGERRAFPRLLHRAFRHGRPTALDVAIGVGVSVLPPRVRRYAVTAWQAGRRAR